MEKENKVTYAPPKDMWEVNARLDPNEAISDDDPRYVHTEKGRGHYYINPLLKKLGVDRQTGKLHAPKNKSYNFFCGHTGCGKSSELLRLTNQLRQKNLFFIVFLDCQKDLDLNNLHYPDVMLALASKLIEELKAYSLPIDHEHFKNLTNWFSKKILESQKLKDLSLELGVGGEISAMIPLLGKLFAGLTAKIKSGATYKEEIRQEVKNSFSEFAACFNRLLVAAEVAIQETKNGKKILFIVDGTDRLTPSDSRRLFIEDVHQLKQIEANFIYCGPIELLYEGNRVQQEFTPYTLPMIKIYDIKEKKEFKEGYEALKKIIYLRADSSIFEN